MVAADPVAPAFCASPGESGADVVVGEGQTFGTAARFGGPYLGSLRLPASAWSVGCPGGLVGETVDAEGRRAYVTTLRAREQDIRREKAVVQRLHQPDPYGGDGAIQLGWLGTAGLRELALRCARGARYARDLLGIDGVEPAAAAARRAGFALRTPVAAPERHRPDGRGGISGRPARRGGLDGADEDGLLVAVTERRTRAEIDALAAAMEKAVR